VNPEPMLSSSATTFAAAPLDAAARIVTIAFWGSFVLAWAAGGFGLSGGDAFGGTVLCVLALALGVLGYRLRAAQAVVYELTDGGLDVQLRGGRTVRRAGAVAVLGGGALETMRSRMLGSGGVYGYSGWLWTGGERFVTHLTARTRAVRLRVGGHGVVLSPADPRAFVAAIDGDVDA